MRVIEMIINYLLITPAIFLFYKYFAVIPNYLKLVGFSLSISFIIEAIAAILLFKGRNNLFLFHFLNPIQFLLYSFYIRAIITNPVIKKLVLFNSFILLVVAIYLSLKVQPFNEYNSYWLLLQNMFLSLYLLFYFYEEIAGKFDENSYRKSIYTINIGLFIFSISNLFIGGILNTLIKYDLHIALLIYFISAFVSYVTYVCFIIAFKMFGSVGSKY